MIVLTITLIAIIAILVYIFFTWNYNYWKKRGVDGPKPKPFIGSFPGMFSAERHMVHDFDDIYKEYKNKERFVGVYNWREPQLLITDPKLGKDVLITHFKNFHDNTISKSINKQKDPLFSEHPFTLTGEEWKSGRQLISPSLNSNRIRAYYPIIEETSKRLVNFLNKTCKNPPKDGFEAKELAMMYTLDIVGAGVYGIDSGTFSEDHPTELFKMAKNLFNQNLFFFVYLSIVAMFPKIKNYFIVSFFSEKVGKFFLNVVKETVKNKTDYTETRANFLGYLMELNKKKPMSTLEMAAHTMIFLIDGFDTTAHAISTVLLYIARHPECQEKIIQEAEDNLDENGSLNLEKLQDMKYLDNVFHEAMRLIPAVLFFSKICTEPIEIEKKDGSKVLIEKGIEVVVPIYSFQKDAEYFEDPDRFDPERFTDENSLKKTKSDGLLLPFGDGPRACMGIRLASLKVKAFMVEVVRNFKISPNIKTKKDNVIDPNSFGGALNGLVWLDFEPRKKSQ